MATSDKDNQTDAEGPEVAQDVEAADPSEAEEATGADIGRPDDADAEAEMEADDKTEAAEEIEDAEVIAETGEDQRDGGAAAEERAEPEAEPVPEPAAAPDRAAVVVERRGGFVPLLLGGLVAGGIGYVIASYAGGIGASDVDPFEAQTTATLERQETVLSSIQSELDGLGARPDPSGLIVQVEGLTEKLSALEAEQSEIGAAVDALDDRLTTLEKQPIAEGVSDAAIEAYERELEALRASVAEQRKEIEAVAAEARETEQSAQETAEQTLIRSALGRVQAALDSGAPFRGALGELSNAADISAPDALTAVAADGAPTVAALQDAFPDAARRALAATRQQATETGGGLAAFLQTQLGARSVTPREGSDPDAVLSRAEAALRGARLTDTLAELETLPDVARAEMAEWLNLAALRQDALMAADTLASDLNMN